MEGRRITQQDVARAAGVHRATVSMAFSGHPNIPAATRRRIRQIARKLGYAPDPMLAALAAYRSRRRPAAFQGVLAWLVNSADGFAWREHPHFVDYEAGAAERAGFHGFKLETFELHVPGLTATRVAAILRARRVPGLLLCPQPRPGVEFAFPWRDFAALTFGYTLVRPRLHAVAAAHYRAAREAVAQLVRRGYRRPGLALDAVHDRRTDHHYLAGYLVGLEAAGLRPEIPTLAAPYGETAALRAWLDRYRPDAVVTGDHCFDTALAAAGRRAPTDVGAACVALPSGSTRLAGVVEHGTRLGAVAVDLLVAMLHRGERGVPTAAECTLVDGRWHEGATLRRATKAGNH